MYTVAEIEATMKQCFDYDYDCYDKVTVIDIRRNEAYLFDMIGHRCKRDTSFCAEICGNDIYKNIIAYFLIVERLYETGHNKLKAEYVRSLGLMSYGRY